MWSDPLINSRKLSVVLEEPPDVSSRQSLIAVLRHKESWVRIAATGQIPLHPLERAVGKEYNPLLIAFAYDLGFSSSQINVRDVQRQHFTYAHPGTEDDRLNPQPG